MKSAQKYSLVLVTAPDLKTARILLKAALSAQLIACANLLPKIESHYLWRGKMERGVEVLLLMKTIRTRLKELEKLTVSLHPFDTPEFVVLSVAGGNKRYLEWLCSSCGSR